MCLVCCVRRPSGSRGMRWEWEGLSSNHPPPPAGPSPFHVNHPQTEEPVECTGLSHVAQQTLASAGRSFADSGQSGGCRRRRASRAASIYLSANTQTRAARRAPLTTGATNQRSPVAKLRSSKEAAAVPAHSQKFVALGGGAAAVSAGYRSQLDDTCEPDNAGKRDLTVTTRSGKFPLFF